jgi:hypothetical protein
MLQKCQFLPCTQRLQCARLDGHNQTYDLTRKKEVKACGEGADSRHGVTVIGSKES